MNKFNSDWSAEKVQDLMLSHENRTHAETAVHLTKKWGVLVTRDSVKNKYVSESRNASVEVDPKNSRESFDKTQNDEGKAGTRTYFVTSAIAGCSLNVKFCKSVKTFCKERGAKLVVLPMRGIASKDEEYDQDTLAELAESFYTDYTFNSNIEAFDIGLSPTQVNPLTSLSRLVQKKSSLIVASPKQQLDTIPVSNVGIPHIIHSTGAITNPSYTPNRIGMLATEDHIIGGLIVEVADDQIFHLRQVQSDTDGSFFDLDKKYMVNGVKDAQAEAFVLGDYHSGNEDLTAIKAWIEVAKMTKPKHILFHDLFDSRSVSHHEENNIRAKANRPEKFRLLKNELDTMCDAIMFWNKTFPTTSFEVVASNHNEHLDRYLDECRYVKDHHNFRLALELGMYSCDGFNPLEKYVETRVGKIKNLKWLKRDEDFKIAGIQLAAHGDIGPNGAKGSLGGSERSYFKAVVGHMHSPRILRNAWQVGTSTKIRLSYTSGASNWLHASCLVYANGQRQMIISIAGKWKI